MTAAITMPLWQFGVYMVGGGIFGALAADLLRWLRKSR